MTPKRYKNQSIAFTSSPSQVEFPIRIIRVRLFRTFSTNRGSIILPNNRNNRVDYFGRFLGSFQTFFTQNSPILLPSMIILLIEVQHGCF